MLSDQRRGVPVGGIVPLHVRDHADRARGAVRGQDLVRLARGEAHRLLGQHVLARPKGIDHHPAVRVGARDEHGVERLPQELLVVGEPAGAPVVLTDVAECARRNVAQRHQVEALVKLPEVRQVHHLRDQPAADDADTDPRHALPSPAGPDPGSRVAAAHAR